MPTHFQPAALKFLTSLARHNDRVWFLPRKAIYERELKLPLLSLIEDINEAMVAFAPDYIRPAHKTMLRIYRDTRFAKDKRPYKRQVSAWWARHGMEKIDSAGFYLHIHPSEVVIFGGVHPEREHLLAIRRWLAEHPEEYRAQLKSVLKKRGMTPPFAVIDPRALTRMPKGFPADHPAGDLLRAKNWGVRVSLPPTLVTSPNLVKEIVARFRAVAPLVDTLNEAILAGERALRPTANDAERTPRRPLF
ncbi:MAG: DUF2461 domain-containing protein [Bryocella sp.]